MLNTLEKTHLRDKANENRLRDIILGGQDGLVNVLGIVLGVSAASGDVSILLTAALSAAFAEAISMGAVAYTSQISEHDRFLKEKQKERADTKKDPEEEKAEIRKIYEQKGFSGKLLNDVVEKITSNRKVWVDTMMEEELKITDVPKSAVLFSSIVVGVAALIGALIPIVPFFFLPESSAIPVALILSCLALFAVGAYEGKTYVGIWWKSGLRILLIGMGAAGVGYLIGLIFGSSF